MSNSIAPGSSVDVNVKVTALTTNPNVPVTYKTIILKKNLVNGVNTLTQTMMNQTNTKYVVKYDYVLGENITIPENCVLEFDGGSISGAYTLTYNNTTIVVSDIFKSIYSGVTIDGSITNDFVTPEFYGWNENNNITLNTTCINNALYYNGNVKLGAKTYTINNSIIFNHNNSLEGSYKLTTIEDEVSPSIIYNQNDNVYAIKYQLNTVSRGSQIKNIRFYSTYGIQMNAITNDPSSVYFIEKATIYGNQLYPKTPNEYHVGIGLEGAKLFDCNIQNNLISSYKQGIKLAISDLNVIQDNNLRNMSEFAIKTLHSSTYGSQNEIRHNDIVDMNNSNGIYIICGDPKVRLIDNYLESYNIKGFVTNLPVSSEDFDYEFPPADVILLGNRYDYHDGQIEWVYKLSDRLLTLIIKDAPKFEGMYDRRRLITNTLIDNNYYFRYVTTSGQKDFSTFDITLDDVDYKGIRSRNFLKDERIINIENFVGIAKGISDNTLLKHLYFCPIGFALEAKQNIEYQYIGLQIGKFILFKANCKYTLKLVNVRTVGGNNSCNIQFITKEGTSHTESVNVTVNNIAKDILYPIDKNSSIEILIGNLSSIDTDYILFDYICIVEESVGITSDRPTTPVQGEKYFDTTLGKPIYWNGTAWVDVTGAIV